MKSAKEIFKFVQASLNLFKAVPNLENEHFPEYTLNNEKNLEYGFFVTENAFKVCPCVADEKIIDFIKSKFGYNLFELNQGFYKSFKTVTELTPQQILANKLLHYFSTYGLESLGLYDNNLVYIPSDALELPKKVKPIKITIIDAIDKAEIETRANKLIMSGIALSKETLQDLMIVVQFLEIDLNVDEVPNKEFAIRLCKFLNILPKNPAQFLRYMIYVATGSTMLIKSKEVIYNLRKFEKKPKIEEEEEFPSVTLTEKDAAKLKDFFDIHIDVKSKPVRVSKYDSYFQRYIQRNGIDKLARIFHRFKPLWLSFKIHSDYLRSTINKMRKLADKYHKPSAPKFLERVTSAEDVNLEILEAELSKITTYRKISLANAILYRQADPQSIVYSIRNGKAFADKFRGKGLKFDIQKVFDTIIKSIADDMQPNVQGKKIYIPPNFTYAVPVSDKKFIGNIPYGSSYTFTEKSVVVGVHWFNVLDTEGDELRIDLDLHLNSKNINVGWNNDFLGQNYINTKEEKIIFSGDMTSAPIDSGGATEAFFVGESLTDEAMMVNLNYFNRYIWDHVPFKLVLADVNQESIDRQYLIDAHEVAFCVPSEISSGEMFLGFLASNELGEKKFYFFSRDMGKRIVARTTNVTTIINSAMQTAAESFLSLNEILERAGAIFEDVTAENCDINLDPAEVTKDTLIGLLAK